MKKTLYFRCIEVIDSCNTIEQLVTAGKYIDRASLILSPLSFAFIASKWMDKYIQLEDYYV